MSTIVADSCSYAHVTAAIAAASNGDTVQVPSGSATWESMLTINKGINLIADGCTITNGRATADWNYLIWYYPSDYSLNQTFRLSGFIFEANGNWLLQLGSTIAAPYTLNMNVRVDHNTFQDSTATSHKGQAIYVCGSLYGVVDNNTFGPGLAYPIAHSTGGNGLDRWANSPQSTFVLGGPYYLYFEDNTITCGSIVTDGEYGQRYAFRYNTITTTDDCYSLFDMHGEQDTPMAACFGAEIYGNDISYSDYDMTVFKQRSGQALVFINNATGSLAPDNTAYTSAACICPEDYCSAKITHNTYWFRNRRSLTGALWTSRALGGLDCCELEDIPTLGRDVFSETSTPGITLGTLANLPETCSVGQGYWATNQDTSDLTNFVGTNPTTPISGTLYICQATNVWTEFYTPYTYPHPLRRLHMGPVSMLFT